MNRKVRSSIRKRLHVKFQAWAFMEIHRAAVRRYRVRMAEARLNHYREYRRYLLERKIKPKQGELLVDAFGVLWKLSDIKSEFQRYSVVVPGHRNFHILC